MTSKYFYFAKMKENTLVPVFECVADAAPSATEVNAIYSELARQMALKGQAIGSVPKPTHFGVLELHEIAETDEIEDKPLLLHTNGNTVH